MRNIHTILSECNLNIDFLHFPQNAKLIDKKPKKKTKNKLLNSSNASLHNYFTDPV